jgi:uncharacterized protein (DUF1015 family)
MAEIRPFRGLRFTAESGSLTSLTAPPYDVMTPAERNGYAARNPYNIVHLTLPEGKVDDRSKFVKYARASALLSEWRRDGKFVPEATPSFYRYTQKYEIGSSHTPYERTSLICLIKVDPFDKGTVLPHEHTFPGHKEDRLRLLEATRTHLESIFGLFEDPTGSIYRKIVEAPSGPAVEGNADGMKQILEPITDPAVVADLVNEFASKRIWIADGHHRYETSLMFRQALGDRDRPVPEDYMVIALASIADPGLILMPTHRIVASLKDANVDDLAAKLSADFEVERCHSSRLLPKLLDAEANGTHGFGVAQEGGHGLWLTARNIDALAASIPDGGSERLRKLDSTILHKVIFERLLGLSPTTHVEFTRDAARAITSTNEGQGVSFMMAPPSIDDMKAIAMGGERMPQKSTYYYPKIWSGFVSWGLEDFE